MRGPSWGARRWWPARGGPEGCRGAAQVGTVLVLRAHPPAHLATSVAGVFVASHDFEFRGPARARPRACARSRATRSAHYAIMYNSTLGPPEYE
eukprot:63947-Pyramimonas_sp.AAC.1